jgi:hypothetical protein
MSDTLQYSSYFDLGRKNMSLRSLRWTFLLASLALVTGLWAQEKTPPTPAETTKGAEEKPAEAKPKFLRVVRDDKKQPLTLDTIIASYKSKDPAQGDVQVDLIGAVHVGDKAYYDSLNKQFEQYDALLFELVAPKDTKIPKNRPKGATSAVGAMQVGMKEALDLEYQLDCIDYSKANFVHADMSPEEFSKTMDKRGESFAKMYFRAMGYSMSRQSNHAGMEFKMLFALLSKNRSQVLKAALAEQFDDLDFQIGAIEGPEGSTILTERNIKALEVLKRELAGGKKKLAIFYGAAHLPDMEKRLLADFNMQRTGESWLVAWDMQPKK